MPKLSEVLWGEEAWCRGMIAAGSRVCLIGAVAQSLGFDPATLQAQLVSGSAPAGLLSDVFGSPSYRRLVRIVESMTSPHEYMSVGRFNDTSDWATIAEAVARHDELTRQEEMGL